MEPVTLPRSRGSPSAPLLSPRYEYLHSLGEGGMSRVFRVRDRARNADLALKILNDDSAATLASEFRFIASLNHPGIIAVHDFGLTPDGRPFFTMELLEGVDLVDFGEQAPLRQAMRAVRAIFETLDFVHARGIIHGDLKPANILMTSTTDGQRFPKLLDFGIATLARHADGQVSGTVNYMAPELITQRRRDPLTDLYAMGAVLFEVLTGELLFDGPNTMSVLRQHLKDQPTDPGEIREDVRGRLADVVLRLLEKAPEDRFQRGREVVAALDGWLASTADAQGLEGESTPPPPVDGKDGQSVATARWVVAAPRVRMAGGSRFVGRDQELARIVSRALEMSPKTANPKLSGALFLLSGPSGSGKTRLLEEMRVRVQLGGVGCVVVDLSECRSSSEALERLAATIAGAAGESGLVDKTRQMLSASGPPSLGSSLPEAETPIAERLVAEARRLASICVQQAHARPLVLSIDGLDAMDDETAAALREFVTDVVQAPVVAILAGTLLPDLAGGPEAEEVTLGRVERANTDQIVRSLLGEMEGSTAIVEHVHTESGGYPGAIERVVRALVASGAIVQRKDAWVVAPHLAGKLPALSADAGQREIALASLAGLSMAQHRVAAAAASLGLRFDVALLEEVMHTEAPAADLHEALRELVEAQIFEPSFDDTTVTRSSARYRFVQRVTRELLLESLEANEQTQWSERIVAALRGRADDREPESLELLARHLTVCGRSAEAAEIATELVQQAIRSGLVTDAPDLLRHSLGTSPRAGALSAARWCEAASLLAQLERRRGNPEEAIAWYRRIIEAAAEERTKNETHQVQHTTDPGIARTRAAARRELGDLLMERGEPGGQQALEVAVRDARAVGDAGLIGQAAYTLANRLTLAGRHQGAERALDEALRMAEQSADRALRARVLKLRATLNWYRGNPDDAVTDARQAAREYEALGSPRGAAVALGALGNALLGGGRLEQAGGAYREALGHARAAGWLTGIGKLENGLAIVLFHSGEFDGACEHWQAALAIAERTRNRVEQVVLMSNIGLIAAWRGDAGAALAMFDDGLALARQVEYSRGQTLVLGNLGELKARQGRYDEARSHLREALAVAESIGLRDQAIETERRLLEVEVEAADPEGVPPAELASTAKALLARAKDEGVTSEIPHVRRVTAQAIVLASDRSDEACVAAAQLLDEACKDFEEHASRYEAARVIRVAAELAASGLVVFDRLASRLPEARKLFRRLGAQPELDRLRQVQDALDERPLFPKRGRAEATRPLPAIEEQLRPSSQPSDTTVDSPLDPAVVAPLLEVLRELGTMLDLGELLPRIVDEAIRLAGTDRGFFMLCDRNEQPCHRVSRGIGGADLDDDQIRVSRSVLARTMDRRRPVIIRDVSKAEGQFLGKSVYRLGIRAVACLPLVCRERLIGLLYLDATDPGHEWDAEQLGLLELFASHAAVALDTARRFEDQQRRAELVVTGAHELVNPLRAILGYARLLRRDLSDRSGDAATHATVVHEQATRLSRMVSGLIDLAASEPNRISWTAVSVQVKDLATTAAEQIRPVAAIHGIELEVAMPPGLPTLFGNRDRLIQATANLLATAVSLSGGGGRVTVKAAGVSSASTLDRVLPRLEHERDPLLPAPEQGYELSRDAPVRIDVESRSAPPEQAGRDTSPPPPARTVRDAVFGQLGTKGTAGTESSAATADPALTIAQQVVHHHGGTLWAERLSDGGTRLSMLFPSLVQRAADGAS